MGNKKNKKVTGKKTASSASKTEVQHVDFYLPLISPK
jgi:ribosomal protein L25 (general stress protein Ctc)